MIDAQLEVIQPSDALAQITRAETDSQITTAKKYPRDFGAVKKKMLSLATLDEETAGGCFYRLNRQGKSIEGASVRMAEIAVSCFGNIRAGARVIANDGKTITAQGVCHDLENNVCVSVEVKRRITDKSGRTYSDDMVVVTGNAACAIAFRNACFKVVPMAMVKPVVEAAKRAAVGDIKTIAERRTSALKYFATLGVNEKQVLAYLGKTSVDGIDLTDVENLIGLSTALKEGSTSVDEAFADTKTTTLKIEPKAKAQADKPTPQQKLAALVKASRVEEGDLLAYLLNNGITIAALSEITAEDADMIVENWTKVLEAIK